MRSKLLILVAVLMMASLFLGACQPSGLEAGAAEKSLTMNLGPGDIPTIDPALGTDTNSIQVAVETFVGLTRQHEVTNEVEPGMATTWDISDDGLVYTFHLRDDVPWVKYDADKGKVVKVQDCNKKDRMVTADDFYYGIIRTLKPETASNYAYVLGMAIKGANEFNIGDTTDPETVGVKVVDENTLEMTFLEPAVYNAAIAGMWVAFPQPSWLIDGDECTEAYGDAWADAGVFESYGPYTLKDWLHDESLTIIANPFWPGMDSAPKPKIGEVTFTMLDWGPALAEYEAGNIEVTDAPLADMDRLKSDPVLSEELGINPYLCTYYYGFNTQAEYVDDVRVRRALSMAIDRQSLIDNVTKGEQTPAQWFSRPGLAGAPTLEKYPDLGVKYDPEAAKASLQEYLDESGMAAEDLDITLMFNTSENHQKIAEAIQAMWKDSLGIEVKVINQEWKVYLETIRSKETPQVYRLGWCLDYADANNFIRENFVLGGSANPGAVDDPTKPEGGISWYNEEFEKGVLDAVKISDPDERMAKYADMEEILVWDDAAIAPIYWYTKVQVTKPTIDRTNSSGGQEYIEKWDIVTE